MQNGESGEKKASRQCWACLKRRLVCDYTLPSCKKCQKAGRTCSGYDEQKPLQWVETGKVTSRRRKKNYPPTIYRAPQGSTGEISEDVVTDPKALVATSVNTIEPLTTTEPHGTILSELSEEDLDFAIWYTASGTLSAYLDDEYYGEQALNYAELIRVGTSEVSKIFALGGRAKMEEVVAQNDHDEAAKLFPDVTFPLARCTRLLHIMRDQEVPSYDYLTHETNEVVQAVNYYNIRIHPLCVAAGELAQNPALVQFPLAVLHILPPAMHHTIVCLALNHYIHTLPSTINKSTAVINRSKVYHHRGVAIRALSDYVGRDKTRCSDFTIASILMFMSMELQNPAMADWRSHASGMRRLIDMRGGLKALTKAAPHLGPTIVIYVLIVVMANTCSPSWDQLELSGSSEENIEDIRSMYNLIFPYTLCPLALFTNMLKVNHLRRKASVSVFLGDMEASHCLEAHDLLNDIEAFVPGDWAQPGKYHNEWSLIGTVYQAAVALYCTMALQSLTILPNTPEFNSMRSVHGNRLHEALKEAIKSPRLNYYLVWPLAVMGVEAGYRDTATQYWIEKQFAYLSRTLGTSSPLKARAVMRRYWQKEEPGWDECFDCPYVFVI